MWKSVLSGFFTCGFFLLGGCSRTEDPSAVAPSENFASAASSVPAGSGEASSPKKIDTQIPVIATFSILGDWVRQVGGDRVRVTTLVGPGADAHTYEPIPRDAAAITEATLVFEIGLEFETWLNGLMESSGGGASRIIVSQSIEPRKATHPDSHHEVDPHVWHDPLLVISMVGKIEAALSQADPPHADEYKSRASAYVANLESLHEQIQRRVASIPADKRHLVTTHDTFGYFADRYGFRVSSVLGTVSSEVTDPSAAQVADLVDQLRKEKTPAVFTENMINPELTQQVASEAQIRIVTELYTDALGPEGSAGDSYLRLMESNMAVIAEALDP